MKVRTKRVSWRGGYVAILNQGFLEVIASSWTELFVPDVVHNPTFWRNKDCASGKRER